ncbi:thiosulfate sulfurtransferase GlpE [Oceanicoccus sagamiensis]|uniref:Thiosulfate sulfurtransferase n=1 Tax=Oceanicoccus sagamiensis TaxID=716816 RepID=A0A1X9NLT5_9GAMM|nr:thiosulfate sulfurtransferase GlpE [Oceanicoccus sagamiensis]ARN74903.1 thiosulfate sulfurtransferase [Oceanicoccus sagamiensis]
MADFKRISTIEAKALIDTGTASIVDVRDAQSFNNGHIEGALLLDNNSVDSFISSTAKDTPVIVYCYHGNSSQNAGQFLAEQGFTEVYSVDGGFELWRTQF